MKALFFDGIVKIRHQISFANMILKERNQLHCQNVLRILPSKVAKSFGFIARFVHSKKYGGNA